LHAQNSESELRAAYIFNFAKYIKWPTDYQTFVIGVYGDDKEAFDALERTLKGKKIAGKEIQIKIFETFIDITSCQILYCPDIENKRLTTLLEMLAGKSVLLVTKEDLVKRGAMISFIVENDKLRFKIKKDALDRAGLVPTEGLLRLAILL
jgi:hypothetical protein